MKFLGNTDEVNTCDCCGRSDLKSTVALEDEAGEVVYYGVVCAAKALKMSAVEVKGSARKADQERIARERAAQEKVAREEDARWQAFLDSQVAIRDFDGRSNRFAQIQALGGAAAAKALYKAVR